MPARSQCSSAARTSVIFAARGVLELGRDELRERQDSGLRLGRREGRVVRLDDVVGELGHGRDPDELTGDEIGADAADELAKAEPLLRGRAAGADPRVQDDEARDAIGPLDGEPAARSARPSPGRRRSSRAGRARRRSARSIRSGSRRSSPRSGSACRSARSRSSRARRREPRPRSSGSSCGRGTPRSARRAGAAPDRRSPRRRSASAARPARRSARRRCTREGLRSARRACDTPPRSRVSRTAHGFRWFRPDLTQPVIGARSRASRSTRSAAVIVPGCDCAWAAIAAIRPRSGSSARSRSIAPSSSASSNSYVVSRIP